MDAIDYLRDQHYEIESLFDQIDSAARATSRLRLRRKLVDLIAVHAAVEELIFYPAARSAGAEELLLGALVEHVAAERTLAELADVERVSCAEAAARMSSLKERKKRHARAEEATVFPRARELLTSAEREALGARMADLADQLLEPGVGARERLARRRAVA